MRGGSEDGHGVVRESRGQHGGLHEQAGEGVREEPADCRGRHYRDCGRAGAGPALLALPLLCSEAHGQLQGLRWRWRWSMG